MFCESLQAQGLNLTFLSLFFCIIYVDALRAWCSVLRWNFLVAW